MDPLPINPTPEARLRFIVEFASLDLNALKESGWRQLRHSLGIFTMGGREHPDHGLIGAPPTTGSATETSPEPVLRRLQTDVSAFLGGLVDARDGRHSPPPVMRLADIPQLWVAAVSSPPGPPVLLRLIHGLAIDDAVRFMVWDLFGREPSPRLRRCPESLCGHRLFYRRRRQLYCSPRCLARVVKRHKRAAERRIIEQAEKIRQGRRQRQPGRRPSP